MEEKNPSLLQNSFQNPLKETKKDLFILSPSPKNRNPMTNLGLQINIPNSPSTPLTKNDYSPYIIKSGSITYKQKSPINFLTQNKRKISNSTAIYTKSPNSTVKSQKLSDRFIPLNKGVNLMEKFNLANKYNELDENWNNSNIDNNITKENNKYNTILKQNVFNFNDSLFSEYNNEYTDYIDNSNNFTYNFNDVNNSKGVQKLKEKIFSFKSENKPKTDFYSSLLMKKKYNDENMNNIERKINTKPYKIIQANELLDDFYLNLVDWSSKNDIAMGLGNKVQLLSTNQTQTNYLCTYDNSGEEKYVSSVMWHQDGNLLAVGNSQGMVEIYDVNKLKKTITLSGHEARVGVVAWNNNIISSGSKDCTILSRDIRCNNSVSEYLLSNEQGNSLLNKNNLLIKFIGHNQEVCGLKWSFDHTQLASGGNDNNLMIWELASTKPLMCNSNHSAAVKAIAWSPHQHNLLVSGGGTADRTIRFWNTTTFNQINKIDTGSQVCNLVFSKTVNELVSTHGFSLNQIILWKLPSMNKIITLTGHTYRVLYLGLSPDGQNIVTGAGDQTLRFWNLFPPFKMDSNSILFPSNKDIR